MLPPPPGAPAIEHLEVRLWRLMVARAEAIGEQRFRRIVRLVIRFFPEPDLRSLVRAGRWNSVDRQRLHRVLHARVRETMEAIDPETIDAWPIVLDGTVSLIWVAIQEIWYADPGFRDSLPELRAWVGRHGVAAVPEPG